MIYMCHVKNNCSAPAQMEVTLITSRSEARLQSLMDSSASELDLQHLRKIHALVVTNSNNFMADSATSVGMEELWESQTTNNQTLEGMSDLGEISECHNFIALDSSRDCIISNVSGLSILDVTVLDSDVLSLQNALHSWLHDCSTDQEHLHLILPPSTSQATVLNCKALSGITSQVMLETTAGRTKDKGDREDITTGSSETENHTREVRIKCDFQERVLNPSVCFDSKLGDSFVSVQNLRS